MLEALPGAFTETREALHALAEHVVAPARYHADGHIWLVPTPGGFGTPEYGNGERLRVDGVEIVHERPGATTRVRITTLGDAAQFAGVALGAPTDVYKPATACLPDAPLSVDAASVHALAAWLEFGRDLLTELRDAYAAQSPSNLQLWPEHFDLACELGDAGAGTRANYGASLGDGGLPEPYFYVGPWETTPRTGPLGAYPFGAALMYAELSDSPEPRALARDFLFDCAALLLGAP